MHRMLGPPLASRCDELSAHAMRTPCAQAGISRARPRLPNNPLLAGARACRSCIPVRPPLQPRLSGSSQLTGAERLVRALELLARGELLALGVDALVVVDKVLLWGCQRAGSGGRGRRTQLQGEARAQDAGVRADECSRGARRTRIEGIEVKGRMEMDMEGGMGGGRVFVFGSQIAGVVVCGQLVVLILIRFSGARTSAWSGSCWGTGRRSQRSGGCRSCW